jgi:hypothetical protein
VLPIIIITTAEAIRAVPSGLREAGLGVGATQWEATRDHVLPYAAPGILTARCSPSHAPAARAAPLLLIGAITGRLASPPGLGLVDRLQDSSRRCRSASSAGEAVPAPGEETGLTFEGPQRRGDRRAAGGGAAVERRCDPAAEPIREGQAG